MSFLFGKVFKMCYIVFIKVTICLPDGGFMEKENELKTNQDEEFVAPAILIFKDMDLFIDELNDAQLAQWTRAVFKYANNKEEAEISDKFVKLCFLTTKKTIDINELKYIRRCKANKRNAEKKEQEKNKSNPPDKSADEEKVDGRSREPTGKDKPPGEVEQGRITEIQARFLNAFKERCPNQAINCKISDFPDVDLAALMFAIQKSPQYLMNAEKNQNLGGLRWYLENATAIIAGKYEKFSDDVKKLSNRHNYSREEYNSLFQNVDDIEV